MPFGTERAVLYGQAMITGPDESLSRLALSSVAVASHHRGFLKHDQDAEAWEFNERHCVRSVSPGLPLFLDTYSGLF